MPRNGSGTYSLPQPPFVSGTVISSAAMNSNLSDIASALTTSIASDGQTPVTGQLKLADGSVLSPSWAFTTETNTGLFHLGTGEIGVVVQGAQVAFINSGGWQGPILGGTPIGAMTDFAGSSAPSKWYLCYGQAVSRSTYASLFAVIGTTYGSGDGVTTFNLPDCRGRLIYGLDNMGGVAAGRLTSTTFGSSPTTIGDAGGNQNYTILKSDLPNVVPTFSGTPGVATSSTVYISTLGNVSAQSGSGVIPFNSIGTQSQVSANYTPAGTISSINGNVTQTSIITVSPGMVVNKIIYAGV